MDKQERINLSGIVIYLHINEGSKSECTAPFLYQGREVAMPRLMLKDDNPFVNKGLFAYDGLTVAVTGKFGYGETFIVDEVRKLTAIDG